MSILPSWEEDELRSVVAQVVRERFSLRWLRDGHGKDFDPRRSQYWSQLADLGFFNSAQIAQPGHLRMATMLLRESGRGLLPGPIVGSAVAASFCSRKGLVDVQSRLQAGTLVFGYAAPDSGEACCDAADRPLSTSVVAWHAVGVDGFVICSPSHCHLVRGGDVVKRIESIEDGLVMASIDISAAESLGTERGNVAYLLANLLFAAELAGVLEAVCEMSTSYANKREQFGVPIGSFQAVKHRCANMALRAHSVWAIVSYAAILVANGHAHASAYVHAAKLLAGEYAAQSCKENIQNHGAFGFTDECDAHLFLKRSLVLARAGASRGQCLDALASSGYHFLHELVGE